VAPLVEKTVSQDPGLKLIWVLGRNKAVIAYCRALREGGKICADSPYQPGSDATLKDESWGLIQKQWEANVAGNNADTMVPLEVKDGEGRLRLFAYPIFSSDAARTPGAALADDSGDQRWGYVALGYDLAPIDEFARLSQKQKKDASYKSALRTGAVGALFVLMGSVLAIFQGLSISKPIKLLAWKADQIARGDLDARVEVKSTDEIGLLGENFNFMADQLVVLLHQTAEKATMEKELEVARTIQETLVPPNDPVDHGTFRFAGYFQPASQCGGDWWTYHDLVGDKVLVLIGDVTGHGVPSAMITATAKAACDVARAVHHDDVSVTRLLEIMNNAIYQSAKRKFVMTCFASIIDTKARTITYANAGHNFPYLYRSGEDGKGEFGSLMIRGNRLGDLKESKYEAKTTELLPGDTLVWYTDGIVECESATGEEYGEKRFRASIRRAAHLDAGDLRDTVVNEALGFFGEAMRKDDITLVIGRMV
jgi:serine phosphatase RsbU (regulator of sigma subunit)